MAPSHALATREGAAKRWYGVHAGRLLSLEMRSSPGCRRLVDERKATPLAAFSRAVSGPRGVEEPVHARDLSMPRTGRSHDHPPVVMEGRVVRGRPRP